MLQNFQKISDCVAASSLSREKKDELLMKLLLLKEEDLNPLLELFSKNPLWISRFYRNIKDKERALKTKSKSSWGSILLEEKSILQNEEG